MCKKICIIGGVSVALVSIVLASVFYGYYWKGHMDTFFDSNADFRIPEMVSLRGGWFEMGDASGDGLDNERPVHKAYVKDFLISKYETSNRDYAFFIKDVYPHYYKPDYWYEREFNRPEQPVVGVSWYDSKAFCLWLSNKTGRKFRLPTEAEWEFAARGGLNSRKYSWGHEIPPRELVGNFPDEAAMRGYNKKNPKAKGGLDINRWTILHGYDDGYVYTAPVGQFAPNGFGLHDMAGNVFEWCEDWYSPKYYKQTDGASNPINTVSSSGERVIRGGCWYFSWKFLSLSTRQHYPPWKKYGIIGFRIVEETSRCNGGQE